MVSQSHRFVWYSVPKAATRSLIVLFQTSGVDILDSTLYLPVRYRAGRGEYDDFYHFSFVRNPWDRLVSCWFDKVKVRNHFRMESSTYHQCAESFPAFVEWVVAQDLTLANEHYRLATSLIDLAAVDFIGRVENLDQDLAIVAERIGLGPAEAPQRNVSGKRDYRSYYNYSTRTLVGEAYRRDVEVFGYDFNGLS
jgi:hypothetical protein